MGPSWFAERPDAELDLVDSAVTIARIAHPGLEPRVAREQLDQLAAPLAGAELSRLSARAQAAALSEYLYAGLGFRGNMEAYADPENSFIDSVIERRLGIPISLALVYMEVARRLGVRARGVGFPGHFLVRIDDERERVIIDPFFRGEILDRPALVSLLGRVAPRMSLREEMLEPVSVRQLVARMLINLRGVYTARAEPGRLLAVLDLLIDLIPDALDEVRERGFLCARLGARQFAAADLRRYLDGLPHAGDVPEVRRTLAELEANPGVSH